MIQKIYLKNFKCYFFRIKTEKKRGGKKRKEEEEEDKEGEGWRVEDEQSSEKTGSWGSFQVSTLVLTIHKGTLEDFVCTSIRYIRVLILKTDNFARYGESGL